MQNYIILSNVEILIEPLRASDLKAALELERKAQLSVSSEAHMLDQLQSPNFLLLGAFPQSDNAIHGLSSRSAIERSLIGLLSGCVVIDELEIHDLVVVESARRQGVGKALLTDGLRLAWQRGAKNAHLEVHEENLAALLLYQSLGFIIVGRRKDYYRNPTGDALRLQLDLSNSALILDRIQP
jgi:[ribosomal protein S18]-alanine N-acetyltransferase